MTIVQLVTQIFSTLTLLSNIAIIFVIMLLIFKKGGKMIHFLANNAVLLSFIIALVATLGSLFYSEIAGYDPCKLCWLQRIAMYPMVIIFLVALLKKERKSIDSAFILSLIGGAVAIYHYIGQLGFVNLPCPVVGYSVTCSKIFFLNYGYITFPFIAFSAFALIAMLHYLNKKFVTL